jgi:hypothetical protein
MNSPDKKAPGRPRSIESHQAMLKATLELLAEVGFDAMSIEAIATRAGVGWLQMRSKVSVKMSLFLIQVIYGAILMY